MTSSAYFPPVSHSRLLMALWSHRDDSSPMSRSVTDSVDAPDRLALITWSQLKEGEKEVGEAAKKDALRRRNSTSVYGASGT